MKSTIQTKSNTTSGQLNPVYIISNWKSNPATLKDLEKLQKAYSTISSSRKSTRLIVCPPPIYQLLDFEKQWHVGAQAVSLLENATGNWNAAMLKEMGVEYCILGHSEQRQLGETDVDIRNKMVSLLSYDIAPIICLGEVVRDEQSKYLNILKFQLHYLCSELGVTDIGRVIFAYEPVWAIGASATRPCTPDECHEMLHMIRSEVATKVGCTSDMVAVVYGGSVNANNAAEYLSRGTAEGLLIGRSSLDHNELKLIIKSVDK